MNDFCKIFKCEKYGQILVINDTNDDDRPSVQVKFNALSQFGICSIDAVFNDNDDGYAAADKAFENMTAEDAIKAVSSIIDSLTEK
jgi:hypothetical protein